MHDSGITCTNNPGSFSCVCNAGYSGITIDGNESKKKNQKKTLKWIIDINECLTNNGGCSINAMCTNTIGSFDCTCQTGYSGDGISCTGKLLFFFFFSINQPHNIHWYLRWFKLCWEIGNFKFKNKKVKINK